MKGTYTVTANNTMASEAPGPINDDQCQRWQHSLKIVLEDPKGYAHFYWFLQKHEEKNRLRKGEYCRYLDFWKECEDYKKHTTKTVPELKTLANDIYEKYLSSSADNKIALDGDERIVFKLREFLDDIEEDNEEEKTVLLNAFDDAVEGMRKFVERGGCRNAYNEWTEGLKSDEKKKSKFRCRLM
ncbi:unnamed protein product [Meganyctiphanes norvegica]|uniref:RGS domain-containing protein n=1 Tax=Meganyctiphanes norvegica TaxID=48144 RepID=A0AAV2Q697_MEGNR